MPDLSVARRLPQAMSGGERTRPAWWPAWSVPAGLRTLRAVLVVPSLFALTFEGFGNLQMALFAAFGGFASLIMASFGGSRRDKLIAHFGLAVIGSLGLIIGTAVTGITWLAVLVTFGIFFAGVAGPNAASGVTAALLPYVLPVATPGTVSMIPDRLAGWWLASVVSTAVVLLIPAPSPGDRLRAAAAQSARTLARHLEASARGTATAADTQACQEAKHQLMTAFAGTPYRPVGLATADQGMASVVQLLEWCTSLIADATEGHPNLDQAAPADRDLFAMTAVVLGQAGDLLAGTSQRQPDAEALDRQRQATAAYHESAAADEERGDGPGGTGGGSPPCAEEVDGDTVEVVARHAFHAQAIALVVRNIVADALDLRRDGRPDQARQLPFCLVPEQPARVAGAGRGGPGGRHIRGPARVLGGPGHPVGAAHQRGVDRVHGAARAGRHRARLRAGRAAAARHRHQRPGAVGRAAHRGGRGRLRPGGAAVHRRPGRVHRGRAGPVQPARAGRLEGGPAAHRGRDHRLPGEPGSRCLVLAAGRRVRGRRRPRRRVPPRCRLPDPGGGLGSRQPGRAAGRGRRRGHRRDQAR